MFKKVFCILLLGILLILPSEVYAQELSADMDAAAALEEDIELGGDWAFGPSITIPPLMMRESIREGAKVDAILVAGIGGGIALYYGKVDPETGKRSRTFSFSPMTIIMSGNISQDTANELDIGYAMTIGFFNDLIMTGIGYNLGSNLVELSDGSTTHISRWFWLLGFGVSFGS